MVGPEQDDDDVGARMQQATEPTRGPMFPAITRLFGQMRGSSPDSTDDSWLANRAKSATQGFADQQAQERKQQKPAPSTAASTTSPRAVNRPGSRMVRKPKQ